MPDPITPDTTPPSTITMVRQGETFQVPIENRDKALGLGFTELAPTPAAKLAPLPIAETKAPVAPAAPTAPPIVAQPATIPMIRNGETFQVPIANKDKAISLGFEVPGQQEAIDKAAEASNSEALDPSDPDLQAKLAAQQKQGENQQVVDNMGVGGHILFGANEALGAASQAVVGRNLVDYAVEKLSDNQQSYKDYQDIKSIYEQSHPFLTGAEKVAGFGAGLIGGGELGGAVAGLGGEALATAAEGGSLLAKGARGALSGLGVMAPAATADLVIDHNPTAAIESLVIGAGIGGALDVALPLAGRGIKSLFTKTAEEGAVALEEGATTKFGQKIAEASSKLNATEKFNLNKQNPDWVRDIGKYKNDEGTSYWDMKTNVQRAEANADILSETGKGIGDIYKSAQSLSEKLPEEVAATARPNAEKVSQELEKLKGLDVDKIGENQTGQNQLLANKQLLETQLAATTDPGIQAQLTKELAALETQGKVLTAQMDQHLSMGELYQPQQKLIDAAISQIKKEADKDGTIGMERFRQLTTKVNEAFKNAPHDELQQIKNNIAGIYRNERDAAINRIATLSGTEGVGLAEKVQNLNKMYGIAKSLQKSAIRVQGQNEVAHWLPTVGHGGLGGLLGGVAVAGLGVPAGAAAVGIHFVGGQIYKAGLRYMNNGGWVKAARALGSIADDSSNIGSKLIVNSADNLEKHLATIPSIIRALGNASKAGVIANTARHDHQNVLNTILGDTTGLTNNQKLNKVMDQLSQSTLQSQVRGDQHQAVFSDHPEVAKGVAAQQDKLLQYLVKQMPKDPSGHLPFSQDNKWDASKISEKDKTDFQKILAVANNPMHILEELKNNTLTAKQVAAAEYLNPEIMRLIKQTVTDQGYMKNKDISYYQKLQMSLLLGQNISNSLNNIPVLQSAYAPISIGPVGQPQGGSPGGHGKRSRIAEDSRTGAENLMDLDSAR
jgi:hypothetical protein